MANKRHKPEEIVTKLRQVAFGGISDLPRYCNVGTRQVRLEGFDVECPVLHGINRGYFLQRNIHTSAQRCKVYLPGCEFRVDHRAFVGKN